MGDFFISLTGLKSLLDDGALPAILDVRKRAAFETSGLMLPGAAWLDPAEVRHWIGDLAINQAYVVYCVHGHEVSQTVGQTLRDAELDARVLTGGFEAWRGSGGAVVPVRSGATRGQ